MDVRIDFGGESQEGIDDDILEGEIVEAQEIGIKEEQPQAVPPPAAAPKKKSKKNLLIVLIVVLIIVASVVVYIYLPRDPTGITLRSEEVTEGIRLTAEISSNSATQSSGEATINIIHNGSTVYTKNNWKISSNSASITIPYNEFVMDNGNYNAFVEFRGVSDELSFEIDFVLKRVAITTSQYSFEGGLPHFNLGVGVGGEDNALPGDSEIRISSILHEDGTNSITSGIGTWEEVTNVASYSTTLYYDESGNYTFTVDIKNNDVKDASPYADYSVEQVDLINVAPDATFTWSDDSGNGIVNTGEQVDFDGRGSNDDGTPEFSWTVIYTTPEPDQNVHSDSGDQMSYTFNTLGEYQVLLQVIDVHGESDFYQTVINVQF